MAISKEAILKDNHAYQVRAKVVQFMNQKRNLEKYVHRYFPIGNGVTIRRLNEDSGAGRSAWVDLSATIKGYAGEIEDGIIVEIFPDEIARLSVPKRNTFVNLFKVMGHNCLYLVSWSDVVTVKT
jgi:hypothetical protein